MFAVAQSSGLSSGAVADAGSGLFALIWWLLTPLIALWNIIMGFVFATPPPSYGDATQSGSSQQQGSSSRDNAAPDTSVRRRMPGYVMNEQRRP